MGGGKVEVDVVSKRCGKNLRLSNFSIPQNLFSSFNYNVNCDSGNDDVHRAVHVWIFAETTQQLLIHQTHNRPGFWDITASAPIPPSHSSLITAR